MSVLLVHDGPRGNGDAYAANGNDGQNGRNHAKRLLLGVEHQLGITMRRQQRTRETWRHSRDDEGCSVVQTCREAMDGRICSLIGSSMLWHLTTSMTGTMIDGPSDL